MILGVLLLGKKIPEKSFAGTVGTFKLLILTPLNKCR